VFSLVASIFEEDNIITDSDMDLYIEIIKRIARHTEDNNSELIIAYIDATNEELANTRWSNESIITELSNFATVVDVTLAETREELDPRFYIHELDMHPSAMANEHRAAIISSYIQN
jgi:exopolysaccharide biosynthesis predicted pyruvyltransferase EpsI